MDKPVLHDWIRCFSCAVSFKSRIKLCCKVLRCIFELYLVLFSTVSNVLLHVLGSSFLWCPTFHSTEAHMTWYNPETRRKLEPGFISFRINGVLHAFHSRGYDFNVTWHLINFVFIILSSYACYYGAVFVTRRQFLGNKFLYQLNYFSPRENDWKNHYSHAQFPRLVPIRDD